jgi:mannose-6-phosphate isomerase-like protein (cupin superfamily)
MSETPLFPFQLSGVAREKALAYCYETIAGWGLQMPAVDPLVLDFGVDDFARIGEIEFWLANEEKAGYCGKFLFVIDGQTCPYHYHKIKHETFFVVKGKLQMIIDNQPRMMMEGDVLVMEPGTTHSFTGIGPALLLEVSMPSHQGDSHFEDKRVGDSGVL